MTEELKPTGLYPVYKPTEPLLDRRGTLYHDITLDTFLEVFFQGMRRFQWHWPKADVNSVRDYIIHTLLGFCSDVTKINLAQNMLYAMLHEHHLRDWFLDTNGKYDQWANQGKSDLQIPFDKEKILLKFIKEIGINIGKTQTQAQKIFSPFTKKLLTMQKSKTLLDLQKLLLLCEGKHMRFEGYLAYEDTNRRRQRNYTLSVYRDYVKTKSWPGIEQEEGYWLDIGELHCSVIIGEKAIVMENLGFIKDTLERRGDSALRIERRVFMQMLGVTFEELFTDVIPAAHEPIKLTVDITEKGELSIVLSEPEDDIVVELVGSSYAGDKFVSRKRVANDTPKGARNKVLERLLGKTFGPIDYRQKTLRIKEIYFSEFLQKVAEEITVFGLVLQELRAMAYVADRFTMIARITDIVFPKVLSIEENYTEIVECKNPTLVSDKDTKKVISNQVLIDTQNRVSLITGPNQNGKSRYVDSIALNQILFQAGWPVFAKKASMSPKTDLRVHYVHSGANMSGESRFSHECARMEKVFSEMHGTYPLIIVDEPYTGTNYIDAETLLKEVLTVCSEEDIPILLTSHFHGLIGFIDKLSNGTNLHCHVAEDGLFTYQILPGASKISNALIVAEKAGVRYKQLKEIIFSKRNPTEFTDENDFNKNEGASDDLPF